MEFINSKSLYIDANNGQVRIGSISNAVSGTNSSVLGGSNNFVSSNNSAILGGQNNILSANNSFIVGNDITGTQTNTLYTNNVNVNGDLTITGNITGAKTNSLNWNSVYSYTNSNSSFDQASRSFVNSNSATILNGYDAFNWVFSNSATELAATAFVNANSATELAATAFVNANSASIINGYKGSNWVFANSATELSVTSVVNSTSANWNSVYSNVNANSATYATILFTNNKFLPLSGGQITGNLNVNNNLSAVNVKFTGRVEEGSNTKALGSDSHAEGNTTTASGLYSHAEGQVSVASGETSHAEGFSTVASGNVSHAEGDSTTASGLVSHAEGLGTIASGQYSHAENSNTIASGFASHTEGDGTRARGFISHAAGYRSEAVHDRTWIWKGSTATAYVSTTRANQFMVSAAGGAAFFGNVGINTDSISNALTVSGVISGNSLIYANNGNSNQWNSVYSYTNSNSSLDQSARSFVNSNSANILNSYKGSNWVFANSATELSVTSVVNSTSANWNSVYSNVNSNSATYATILFANNKFLPLSGGQISGNLNITNNLSAVNVKFTGRVEEGTGTKALGSDSHAEGNATTASGNFGSHSEGYLSVASGSQSHAEGFNTKAIGGSSHAEGSGSIAYGQASHAENGSIAIGADSHAEGTGTVAYGGASHSEGVESESKGLVSHAAGYKATAAYDYSYAWSGDDTLTNNISSTKSRQYFIYAPSGVYIPRGQVGIGTDSQANALSVVGIISGTSIVYANNGNSNQWNSVYSNVNSNSATYATQNYVKNNFLALSGGSLTGNLSVSGQVNISSQLNVTGNVSSQQIVYSRELDFVSLERPSLTGIKQALNAFLYVAPNLSYLILNGSNSVILEVGQSLISPSVTWNSTKVEPQAVSKYTLTLPNNLSTVGTNTYTFSSYNDTNTYSISNIGGTATQQTSSWSVKVTDWSNSEYTGSVSAFWRYRIYFGATNQLSANNITIYSNADSSVLSPTRLSLGAKTVYATNEYIYVAYPIRFGTTSLIKLNGFNFNDMTQLSITPFVNIYGGTDNYYVYRTNNLLTGTYTVEII